MNTAQLERLAGVNTMRQKAAWMRIQAQIQVAEHVIATEARSASWDAALAKAKDIVAKGVAGEQVNWPDLTERVESALTPLAAAAKARELYLVGHAHIDMNWMWSWPETVSVTLDTLGTMLALLEEFPEFHFSQSQASVYAIVEQYAPEMLPEIARYVENGRWEVTASHWVETDKNIVNGESLCRHVLYHARDDGQALRPDARGRADRVVAGHLRPRSDSADLPAAGGRALSVHA